MSENDFHPTDEETVSKEQYNELVEKFADKTQTTTNLVEELKELREKKQISDTQVAELQTKLNARAEVPGETRELTPEVIAELAAKATQSVLKERDEQTAKENKDKAFADFLSKHKEFHPDNDEGGIKLAALERKLSRFNLSTSKSYEDYMSFYEDAANLMGGATQVITDPSNPNPLPPAGGSKSSIREPDGTNVLTSKEQKIIDQTFGGDKERYLKIKAKRPDYVASLLAYLV